MIEYRAVEELRPAEYNPRRITSQEFDALCGSIRRLGFVLPIIVNGSNHVIVAGHQRLRAAKAIGLSKVPVILVRNLCVADEIKFNQLHNGVQHDSDGTVEARGNGFCEIPAEAFGDLISTPTYLKETCGILLRYGNALSCVVAGGRVVFGSDYVAACQLLGMTVNTYLSDHSTQEVREALNQHYGEFSYQHLARDTYVQGLAQLTRLGRGRQRRSSLYENFVLPWLKEHPSACVLDFGAGRCEYAQMLSGRYDITPLEFYPNNGRKILVGKAQTMIDRFLQRLAGGAFDAVVLDSVLNSVDSAEAEQFVLQCCNAVLRDGGTLFVSGRPLDAAEEKTRMTKDRAIEKRFVEFLDAECFTANFRKGHWYYQHYHSPDMVRAMLRTSGFSCEEISWRRFGDSWQCECVKKGELPKDVVKEAVEYEFNLPLPNGGSFKRAQDVMQALCNLWERRERKNAGKETADGFGGGQRAQAPLPCRGGGAPGR